MSKALTVTVPADSEQVEATEESKQLEDPEYAAEVAGVTRTDVTPCPEVADAIVKIEEEDESASEGKAEDNAASPLSQAPSLSHSPSLSPVPSLSEKEPGSRTHSQEPESERYMEPEESPTRSASRVGSLEFHGRHPEVEQTIREVSVSQAIYEAAVAPSTDEVAVEPANEAVAVEPAVDKFSVEPAVDEVSVEPVIDEVFGDPDDVSAEPVDLSENMSRHPDSDEDVLIVSSLQYVSTRTISKFECTH